MLCPDFYKFKRSEAIFLIIFIPFSIYIYTNVSEISDYNELGTETPIINKSKKVFGWKKHYLNRMQPPVTKIQAIRNNFDGSITNPDSMYNLEQGQQRFNDGVWGR